MADIEAEDDDVGAGGAAGGVASSGKRFEVKKWNAVRRQLCPCSSVVASCWSLSRSAMVLVEARLSAVKGDIRDRYVPLLVQWLVICRCVCMDTHDSTPSLVRPFRAFSSLSRVCPGVFVH